MLISASEKEDTGNCKGCRKQDVWHGPKNKKTAAFNMAQKNLEGNDYQHEYSGKHYGATDLKRHDIHLQFGDCGGNHQRFNLSWHIVCR